MYAIWNWLRTPKNFAVVSAFGAAIGFLIKPIQEQPQNPPQPNVVVTPQIRIENYPLNEVTSFPQRRPSEAPAIVAPDAAVRDSQSKSEPSLRENFPIRRTTVPGISVDFIPGFAVTIENIIGAGNKLTVMLKSDLWDKVGLDFPVGSSPIDITVNGRLYRLNVEKSDGHTATVVLNAAS
ncbi:hypothetical protein [Methylobacter tundripaludum]|uniref:hypothetical protein n=1 Tax=Methylobacter tundripaludum TaxID=173365 RepID=UPI0004853E61|nr:hypothetical protein [Methylobacter tundripaludum]